MRGHEGISADALERAARKGRGGHLRTDRELLTLAWKRVFKGILTFRDADNIVSASGTRTPPSTGQVDPRRRKRRGPGRGGKTTNSAKRTARGWGERRTTDG